MKNYIAPPQGLKPVAPKARKKCLPFFPPKVKIYIFGAFCEGNGLFKEVVEGKLDFLYNFCRFLAIFSHFYSFWCIFIVHCGGVFGHFSDILRICWGHPRNFFGRFGSNFGHF